MGLKSGLAECNEGERRMFKRMYSPRDLGANIDSVVDAMPADTLNRAMEQVDQTLKKK